MNISRYYKRNSYSHFKDYWDRERETISDKEAQWLGDEIANAPRPTWNQFCALLNILNSAPRAHFDNNFFDESGAIRKENKV